MNQQPYQPPYQYPQQQPYSQQYSQQQQYPQQYPPPQNYQNGYPQYNQYPPQHGQQYPPSGSPNPSNPYGHQQHLQQPQQHSNSLAPPHSPYHQPNGSSTSVHSNISATSAASHASSSKPSNATLLSPTHALYFGKHSLYSHEAPIQDITAGLTNLSSYDGDKIPDEMRKAAKPLGESSKSAPLFLAKRKHWYTSKAQFTSPSSATPNAELAFWDHPSSSCGKTKIDFPQGSPHCSHPLLIKTTKWTSRTNTFVVNSCEYTYAFDSRVKESRMILCKDAGGGRQIVVARYAEKWGTGKGEGVLLVDAREVDLVVACLVTLNMLRRTQQRASEVKAAT